MLQALKNLEARSAPRPAATGPLPASAPGVEPPHPAFADGHASPPIDPAGDVESHIDFAAAAIADLSAPVSDESWLVSPRVESFTGSPSLAIAADQHLPAATHPTAPASAAAVPRQPLPAATSVAVAAPNPAPKSSASPTGLRSTPFEKAALRILTDPIRARPLVELAERLDNDIHHTGSQSILLAGVGTSDDLHQALLYTGILLTERQSGDVLMVDADLHARSSSERTFSAALERERQRGLSELVEETGSLAEVCYPTATSRLFVLPAGQSTATDLSTAGAKLELALKKLGSRFAIVLINGGHASQLSASALARHADATYLVVRLGAVEATTAQAALRDFRAGGARVLGCIAT